LTALCSAHTAIWHSAHWPMASAPHPQAGPLIHSKAAHPADGEARRRERQHVMPAGLLSRSTPATKVTSQIAAALNQSHETLT